MRDEHMSNETSGPIDEHHHEPMAQRKNLKRKSMNREYSLEDSECVLQLDSQNRD